MNNIKKLVAFGCSWTFGDELDDPELAHEKENPRYWDMNTQYRLDHCWSGLIAKHYGWEYENHAFPGSSLTSMRDAMYWYQKNNDLSNTMVVVGLTESWRWSWHNNSHKSSAGDPEWNKHINSSWLLHNKSAYSAEWQQTFRSYMEDQLCDDLIEKNVNETLLYFDGIAARHDIPMLQIPMLDRIDEIQSVPTLFPDETHVKGWLEKNNKPREIFKPGRHPNEKGHELISKKLIDYIDANVL
jgi:hypothetical protein